MDIAWSTGEWRVVPEKRGKVQFLMYGKKQRRVGVEKCGGGLELLVEK
jgi:hypothetical protein